MPGARGPVPLGNVASLLNTNLNTDWTQISWGAAGGTSLGAGGKEYVTSAWTSSTGTLGVVNSAAFGTNASGAINAGIAKVNSFQTGVVTNNLISSSTTNSFTKTAPFNFPLSQVVNTLSNSTISASDLYLIKANTDTSVAGGAGVSGFQGTLAVDSTGEITFTVIPETSTYAMILGALSLGFVALRRRFSK